MTQCVGMTIIQELVALGITEFCISPGSRSTPLTQAVALNPKARKYIFIDERSSAFFALGLAKATGRPAVVITTSGTAISNGFPALIEASESGIPIVFISSDRPPELRHSGSNQTIDQVKLFSDKVRYFVDISPSKDYPNSVRSNICEAIYHSYKSDNKGPVHINIMFREPFSEPSKVVQQSRPFIKWESPTRHFSSEQTNFIATHLNKAKSPLLIIGNIEDPNERKSALTVANDLCWPTFCDVSSGISLFDIKNKITAFYLISQIDSLKPLLEFDFVLHIGGNTVVKDIGSRLTTLHYLHIDSRPKQHQPMNSPFIRFNIPISALLNITAKSKKIINTVHNDLSKKSEQCSKKLEEGRFLSEFSSISMLLSHLTNKNFLYISNSLPIRIVNRLHCKNSTETASNRGASGIDGTISSALGWITGKKYSFPNGKGVLLIGDLSFWHELGSLLHYQQEDLLIVLINNGGGGIFHFLPIAQQESLLTKYFATHHDHQFSKIAEQMGCEVAQVHTLEELEKAINMLLPKNNLRLIEVVLSPKAAVEHNSKYKNLLEKLLKPLVPQ